MTRRALALIALFCAAGCGSERPDLQRELREMSGDLRVDPLPQLREREPAAYRGAGLPDPFYPSAQKAR